MNLNFIFKSTGHSRYERGQLVNTYANANRAIKVEPNINSGIGYTVSIYNLDGNHPLWQNNVQMAPKPMKIISSSNDKIVLRGYGSDSMGDSFADYGLTIDVDNTIVRKCTLHMHDRNVESEYIE